MSLKKRNTTSKGRKDNFEEETPFAKNCRVLLQKFPKYELVMVDDESMKTAGWKEKEELERHLSSTSKGKRKRTNASTTQSTSMIRSSMRQRKIVVNNIDSKEKEMLLKMISTKHCHVLLEKLSESELPEKERMKIGIRKEREEELEHHLPSVLKRDRAIANAPSTQNASKLEALTKQGEIVTNKTDSEEDISRKFRPSSQETKRKKQKPRPFHTQSHISKLENDSTKELCEQEDTAPEEEDSSEGENEKVSNEPLFICFRNQKDMSMKGNHFSLYLGYDFFFKAFRKYLLTLRGTERSNILYELLQRDLKQELLLHNAPNLQYSVNKKLVEWIVKSELQNKEFSLKDRWNVIKFAAKAAELSVVDRTRKSCENRMVRKRNVPANENSIFNKQRVPKQPIPNLVDEEVEAAKSIKENASTSVKERKVNEIEHAQISLKGKGAETPILEKESNAVPNKSEVSANERECEISTNLQSRNMTLPNDVTKKVSEDHALLNDVNATNLLLDVEQESNKTEEIVKSLKDETQKSSNECVIDINASNLLVDEISESNKTEEIGKSLKDETQKSSSESVVDTNASNLVVVEVSESNKSEEIVKSLKKKDETQKSSDECDVNVYFEACEQQENLESEQKHNTTSFLEDSSDTDTYIVIDEESESNSEISGDNFEKDDETVKLPNECSNHTDLKDSEQQEISCSKPACLSEDARFINLEIETPETKETEIFVEGLKKYDKTRRQSSEYYVDSKINEQKSVPESVLNTVSSIEFMSLNERNTEGSDNVREISFGEHSDLKQKTILASDIEKETFSKTEIVRNNDIADNLCAENKMSAISSEIRIPDFEKTVNSNSGHIPGENSVVEILLEECIQLVESQNFIPSREPSEVSVAKTEQKDGVAFSCSISDTGSNHSNAQERDCSSTKNTTDLNLLPVFTDDIHLLNNTPENLASTTETETCFEAQLSSSVGSVHNSPKKTGEIDTHEDVSNVYSSTYNKLVELIDNIPQTLPYAAAVETSSDIASPNLPTHLESVHTTAEEKINSSIASPPDEQPLNDEIESELPEEFCEGQGCESCEITFLGKGGEFISFKPLPLSETPEVSESSGPSYLHRLMDPRKFGKEYCAGLKNRPD